MRAQFLFGVFLYELLVFSQIVEGAATSAAAAGVEDHLIQTALECYNTGDRGLSYNGTYNTAEEQGFYCLNWNFVNSKYISYRADNNYCRNPINFTKPWCYTEKSTLAFKFCSLPACDCRSSLSDLNYKGDINISRNGLQCKLWSSPVSSYKSEDSNYCRTPSGDLDNDGGPWCYVDGNIGRNWDRCNVPVCGGSMCPQFTDENVETLDHKPIYRFGETVLLRCKPGYQLIGTNSLSCNQDGTWNDTEPTCSKVLECYNSTDRGISYKGTYNKTEEQGFQCLNWNYVNSTWVSYRADNNYCRNPNNYSKPWCYTKKSTWAYKFCSVPVCNFDECSSHPCNNGGTCEDRVIGYRCTCFLGYTGNNCETVLECYNTTDRGVSYRGTYNTPEERGFHCLNWNYVDSPHVNYRANNNYCRNPTNFTKPWCYTEKSAYAFKSCSVPACDFEECTSHPCNNGGTCEDRVIGYRCTCSPGYTGNNCETDIDECGSNPCNNGGTCVNRVNGYQCTCFPGYTGINCETDKNDCVPNPCRNGGTCGDKVNGYLCKCSPGYTDNNCGTDINECASSPCLNGGTCEDRVNGYNCTCSPGYSGSSCETDINECASSPCLNGGECKDRVNGYQCTCSPGYSGNNCKTDIDECVSSPCFNFGTCVDKVNGYKCTCSPGYTGSDCVTDINECASNPCQNNAICEDRISGYYCLCSPGYRGNYCDTEVACEPLNRTKHLQFPNNTFFYQDNVTFYCDGGHQLSDSSTLQCVSNGNSSVGKWNASQPTCLELQSDRLSTINVGAIGGGLAAAIVVIIIVVLIVFMIRRRRMPYQKEESVRNNRSSEHELESHVYSEVRKQDTHKNKKTATAHGNGGTYINEHLEGGGYYNFNEGLQMSKTAVPIKDFYDYVENGRGKGGKLEQEFLKLKSGLQNPTSVALKPENKIKNKYKNLYAYDATRVVLETTSRITSDYINASYINGYGHIKQYIASQGPQDNTVNEFWEMIWQMDCGKIVMLTNVFEEAKKKCNHYWPEDVGKSNVFEDITVTLSNEDIFSEFTIRHIQLKKQTTKKSVVQFHFTAWPDKDVPKYSSSVVHFRHKVNSTKVPGNGPVVVHCSAGIGRTGTYIALDYAVTEAKETDCVDVFRCVETLRRQRVNMVQTAASALQMPTN